MARTRVVGHLPIMDRRWGPGRLGIRSRSAPKLVSIRSDKLVEIVRRQQVAPCFSNEQRAVDSQDVPLMKVFGGEASQPGDRVVTVDEGLDVRRLLVVVEVADPAGGI